MNQEEYEHVRRVIFKQIILILLRDLKLDVPVDLEDLTSEQLDAIDSSFDIYSTLGNHHASQGF